MLTCRLCRAEFSRVGALNEINSTKSFPPHEGVGRFKGFYCPMSGMRIRRPSAPPKMKRQELLEYRKKLTFFLEFQAHKRNMHKICKGRCCVQKKEEKERHKLCRCVDCKEIMKMWNMRKLVLEKAFTEEKSIRSQVAAAKRDMASRQEKANLYTDALIQYCKNPKPITVDFKDQEPVF